MRTIILGFAVTLFSCITTLHSHNYQQTENIYIQPEDVTLLNNQILVYSNGQWTSVTELHSDQIGIHFKRKVGLWYCKECGWHNEDVPNCARCGRPRPE